MITLELENLEPVKKRMTTMCLLFLILFMSGSSLYFSGAGSEYGLWTLGGFVCSAVTYVLESLMRKAPGKYRDYFVNNKVTDLKTVASELNRSEFLVEMELGWFTSSKEDKGNLGGGVLYFTGDIEDEDVE